MKRVRVLGGGWYGCSIALGLLEAGHSVEVHEARPRIFDGASGSIPARLHLGFHYPRSRMTRAACLEHSEAFMARYGQLTAGVPVNIYAIAKDRSLVDFDQYVRTLQGEVEFVRIADPSEFGLQNVEGAVLTGERHIVTDRARAYFEEKLDGRVFCDTARPEVLDDDHWDMTVDCTFCANDSAGVDRYEPCLVLLLEGDTNRAVTIMDGQFPSLYPWDEEQGLCSLSSAQWTPFSKELRTYAAAQALLNQLKADQIVDRAEAMIESMAQFYPTIADYKLAGWKLSVRAMPLSGADTRLVDVIQLRDRVLRVRAGKIDAVLHAEQLVKGYL